MAPASFHSDPLTLEPEGLFRNICRRALRDRVVSPKERILLERVQHFLEIPGPRAQALIAEAQATVAAQPAAPLSPLESSEIYRAACSLAWMDDGIEPAEEQLMADLARALWLSEAEEKRLANEIRELQSAYQA